jgi:hypothetical protein
MSPVAHRSACQTEFPGLRPLYRARAALVAIVNGLTSATRLNHGVMVRVSTKADARNVIGNIQMKPPEFAASTDFTDSPTSA